MILTIVATVSERPAPPIHANIQHAAWLGGACLSETVATIVKIILSLKNRRILKKRVIYFFGRVN